MAAFPLPLLAAFLAAAFFSAAPVFGDGPVATKRKVILDNDGGTGAPVAMLVAAPDVDLIGCTVTSGDSWCAVATAQTLRQLEVLHRTDVPVVPGAVFPLVNSRESTLRWEKLYGRRIYKGAWMEKDDWGPTTFDRPSYHGPYDPFVLPEGNPTTKPSSEIAANFLIEKVRQFPHQVTIIADGPMTNIALAIRLDPAFSTLAKELVFMAGSFNPRPQNDEFAKELTYMPRLEFNFQWDPEAAHIMLTAPWKKITCVPNDATCTTLVSAPLLHAAEAQPSPWSDYLRHNVAPGFPLWDESSVAVWLDPSLIKKETPMLIDVETSFGAGYGNTLSWPEGFGPGLGEQLVHVVQELDIPRLNQLYLWSMQHEP